MKVCVDRTRSTLNESMSEEKKINLTSGSSGSSTCSPLNDNLLADFENAKVPAVVIKKRSVRPYTIKIHLVSLHSVVTEGILRENDVLFLCRCHSPS